MPARPRIRRVVLSAVAVALLAPAATQATTLPVVRFSTSLGNLDVQLLSNSAPNTVANFLSYVPGSGYTQSGVGSYNGSFFHRLVPGFVLQGGGYAYNGSQATAIAAGQAIASEAGVQNTTGTLAMALSTGPNSATDEWFFNLANNTELNNSSDGGPFTVFGRVLDPASLQVLSELASEPTADLTTQLAPGTPDNQSPFTTVPVIGYTMGNPLAASNLETINSITVLPTTPPTITITTPASGQVFTQNASVAPAYSCSDGNGTGIATCSGPASVNTSALGPGPYTVTATDYAGDTTQQSVNYTVEAAAPSPAPSASATTPATTQPATQGTTKAGPATTPSPQLLHGALTVSGHSVAVQLRCARGSATCQGSLQLVLSTSLHTATVHYEVRSGATATVRLTLSPAARRKLSGRRTALAATLELRPTGARRATTHRVTLKLA